MVGLRKNYGLAEKPRLDQIHGSATACYANHHSMELVVMVHMVYKTWYI